MKGPIIFFLLAALLVAPACKAETPQTETQTMAYDVFAGGIHALNAKLNITTGKQGNGVKSYNVFLESGTHGFLRTLAPWQGHFTVKGIYGKDNELFPVEYISSSTWKKETEKKTFIYDGKGNYVDYIVTETKGEEAKDKTPKKIDGELTEGTTDLLSATLTLLTALPQLQECTGESLIFDGDRNFKLVFQETVPETLKKSKYNIYDGDAVSCQVEVIPEKGKWHKKPRGWLSIQEQGRKKGSLPIIWMGKMDGAETYIPVKVRVKTDYGTLFLHLTSYKKG